MARKALLGNKVRRLRRDHELSQIELARRLGISASYLNLIEHNQRPLTLPLLLKLAEQFEIELQNFSQDGEARLYAEMSELFGDPLFQDAALGRDDLNELVDQAPSVCRAVVTLYRAYRNARDDLQSLSERLSDDSFLSTSTHELRTLLTSIRSFAEILRDHQDIGPDERRRFTGILADESARLSQVVDQMLGFAAEEGAGGADGGAWPPEEVADLLQGHGNHFPDLEEAAGSLRREAGLEPAAPVAPALDALAEGCGLKLRLVPHPLQPQPPGSADREAGPLLLSEADPPETRRFQIARQVALSSCATVIEALTAGEQYSGAATAALYRQALAGYIAGALIMPYDPFLESARLLRYDIERLQRRFDCSFEQVCHRLTTLQKLGAKGVPFHFLRVDIAGNVSKRFSASGQRIARYGGVCPRWNLHAAFLTPGRVRRQISRMPDGSTYLDVARTVTKGGAAYGEPESVFAIGLGCDISHARDLVYCEGLDLDEERSIVPVGTTCRLCERADCRQRAYSPILPSLHGDSVSPGTAQASTA